MISMMTDSLAKPPPAPRIVVGIATLGRGELVSKTVQDIARQERLPDLVVVSGTTDADFGDLADQELPFPLKLLTGPKGSCAQRNTIFSLLTTDDILFVMDDDFLLADDYFSELDILMREEPDIVMVTGNVLVDGILGPGLGFDEGKALLQQALQRPVSRKIAPVRNGYGCNMAVRMKPVLDHGLLFDEALPLYAWFEDVDFSVRLNKYGRIVRAGMLRGVHLGTKAGRTPGRKFGYSQVANLMYLRKKGTLSGKEAMVQMLRNFASNIRYSLRPVVWADHRGRLSGNFLALADLARGSCSPSRITKL